MVNVLFINISGPLCVGQMTISLFCCCQNLKHGVIYCQTMIVNTCDLLMTYNKCFHTHIPVFGVVTFMSHFTKIEIIFVYHGYKCQQYYIESNYSSIYCRTGSNYFLHIHSLQLTKYYSLLCPPFSWIYTMTTFLSSVVELSSVINQK